MFAFELTPRDVRLLKFEDIKMTNKQAAITVYRSKNNSWQQIPITESLYKRIIKYENDLTKNGKCFMANISTKEETIVGHFYLKIQNHQLLRNLEQNLEDCLKILIFVKKIWESHHKIIKTLKDFQKESKRFEEKNCHLSQKVY